MKNKKKLDDPIVLFHLIYDKFLNKINIFALVMGSIFSCYTHAKLFCNVLLVQKY